MIIIIMELVVMVVAVVIVTLLGFHSLSFLRVGISILNI
jgi:hypothetical protein